MLKNKVIAKVKKELDHNYKIIKNLYFTQRAINSGAQKELPLETLVILGELLSHPTQKHLIKNVINKNGLVYQGNYLQLDDPYQQKIIRRALSTFEFDQWVPENLQKSA